MRKCCVQVDSYPFIVEIYRPTDILTEGMAKPQSA